MNIQKATAFFLAVTVFVPAFKWFIVVSVRINVFDIFASIFVFLFAIHMVTNKAKWFLPREIRIYLLFLWGWFVIAGLSGLSVIVLQLDSESPLYFIKGIFQLFFYSIFFSMLALYLSKAPFRKQRQIAMIYLCGALASCAYSYLQLFLITRFSIDIDELIANLFHMSTESMESLSFSRYAYGFSFRANGIAGDPSTHAVYVLPLLVLLIILTLRKPNLRHFALLIFTAVSFFWAMSGSGSCGLTLSTLLLFLLNISEHRKAKLKVALVFVFIIFTFTSVYAYYKEVIDYFLEIRLSTEGSVRTHYEILMQSLELGLEHPLIGVGYNNFSIAYAKQYADYGYNPHNSWVTYFINLGISGLIYQLLFHVYIFTSIFKRRSFFSKYLFCAYAGACFAALGYETLNLFFTKVFLTIFYSLTFLTEPSVSKELLFGRIQPANNLCKSRRLRFV